MHPARMERQRGRSAVARRSLSRLIRRARTPRGFRLARRGVGNAHSRTATPPRVARTYLPPRGLRLGGGGELQAPRGPALRPAVLSVGGKRGGRSLEGRRRFLRGLGRLGRARQRDRDSLARSCLSGGRPAG